MSTFQPSTATERYRNMRAQNLKLRREVELYRTYAPDPDTLEQLAKEAAANRALYQATLARNIILARQVREQKAA